MSYSRRNILLNNPNYEIVDDLILYESTISDIIQKYGYTRDVVYKFLQKCIGQDYLKEVIKRNNRISMSERVSWNKGIRGNKAHQFRRKVSKETRIKISQALTGKIGHRQSEKTRNQISKTIATTINNTQISKNPKWKQGYYNSNKVGKTFFLRSSFEFTVIKFLESSLAIKTYEVEPFCIPWETKKGGKRFYTPDVAICTKTTNYLVEIKPMYKIKTCPIVGLKLEAARRWCAKNNYEFIVITEIEIKNNLLSSIFI